MTPIERELSGNVLHLNLDLEAVALEEGAVRASTNHSARTVAKQGSLRLTMIALAPGGHIRHHWTESPVSIQVLNGQVTMNAEGHDYQLERGDLLVLAPRVEHDVSSRLGGLLLLTVSHGATEGG